ncbi:SMR family transporter [Pectobacterium actinidiae]|uniref:DMT family transporter n=1 Tax=Pectobacterium actinidiae TaxID=1507808 RepID=UPI0024A400E1|nr:SMR family transporter [Pectobacterium actinidiae]MDY4316501.1 SMR family transporter [Pectobacterium actinidiae]GLW36116.1 QacE family quaternary ammonium compound efflux SMR transporter [Pectobacterium carotovorum subsp. carotovorum]
MCSTLGTLALKKSERFRKPMPTLLALICYAGSTVLLARAMTMMPVALAHAVWTGIVALTLLGIDRFYFRLPISNRQLMGFLFVLLGIAVFGIAS